MILNPITIVRKSMLAYIGAIAMTGDLVAKTFDQFTRRGGEVEKRAREQTAHRQVAHVSGPLGNEVEVSLTATIVVDNAHDRLPGVLNLSSHDDVRKLNTEIMQLNGDSDASDEKVHRESSEVVTEPLPDYEKLNVAAVSHRLPALEEPTLLVLRAYEQQHGNRVTVLRAVERELISRQAARGELTEPATRTTVDPLPGYNKLTAEEIVGRLHRLGRAELLHIKIYEQEHGNRLTVLRAVEDRLAAKAEE